MSTTVLRPKKDGSGYSECSSPDELVGKGRCCHVLGEAGEQVLSLNKIQRGMYEVKIDDSEKQSSSINISAQKDTIIKFFNSMAKLDDEQVKKIVNFLNEEE